MLAVVALLLSGTGLLLGEVGDLGDPLLAVLVGAAIASELLGVRFGTLLDLTGWDWTYVLALVFLGPLAAVVVALAGYLSYWVVDRYRISALLTNVGSLVLPIVCAGLVFEALDASPEGSSLGFTAAVTLVTAIAYAGHLALASWWLAVLNGVPRAEQLATFRTMATPFVFQAGFAITICGVYAEYGLRATAFAVVLIAAFAYMARLVVAERDKAEQMRSLSWGVLSSLVRTLEARDARAARHSAAVARFSADIARELGLSRREQDLAHVAGLLHDLGRFAMSDRVFERGPLSEDDWRAIRRHPAIGADLLRDLDLYGPVADVVHAHHERIDGRGYPRKLAGDDIPLLARVVATAEVYDTLTAPDTYRTAMTSFEALNELRRVAGSQLDATCVEALSTLLAGRDVAYRHAGSASYDAELARAREVAPL